MKKALKIAISIGAGILSTDTWATCNTTLNSNPLTGSQTIPLNDCIYFSSGNLDISGNLSGNYGNGILQINGLNVGAITINTNWTINNAFAEDIYIGNSTFTGNVSQIVNYGQLLAGTGGTPGWSTIFVWNGSSVGTITNAANATISGGSKGGITLYYNATVNIITNSGTISGTGAAPAISNAGSITEINNLTGGVLVNGISNSLTSGTTYYGTIGTLNNAQGGASPLQYTGPLPNNYNIIINSHTNYGQLTVTSGTGAMNFGISRLSTVGTGVLGNYSHVLSGVTPAMLSLGNATSLTAT